MFQDSKGFMWMGTVNGLSYYDGNSFVSIYPDPNLPISLADPRIRNMEEDSNGFYGSPPSLLYIAATI